MPRTVTITLRENEAGAVAITTRVAPPLKKGEAPSAAVKIAAAMQLHVLEAQKKATRRAKT